MDDFRKAFYLGELPEDIDLDSPPVNGFDYLYRVRLESRKCPKIVVSNIDTTKFIQHQNVEVDFCNGFIPAPPGFEPALNWQACQLKIFSEYRKELFTHRDILKIKYPSRELPKLSKKQEWCIYCLGHKKYDEIYGAIPEQDKYNPENKICRLEDSRYPPLLSIILHLTQSDIRKLLSYHIKWLGETFTHAQGEWLYALLMCLEIPLEPDTSAVLRNLSRVCSKLRSSLSGPEDDKLKPLNTIICIISHYFDQKDMSDISNEFVS